MTTVNKDGGSLEVAVINKVKKTAGRPSSRNSSRNNSKNNSPSVSPYVSPNKFAGLAQKDNEEDEEPWQCEICSKVFSDPNATLLECQRCQGHFCIKCLKKGEAEYEVLSKSDSMWFCGLKCRELVEKNIMMELKIEQRCQEIMQVYEERICKLEANIETKCDEKDVRNIVRSEVKLMEKGNPTDEGKVRDIVRKEVKEIEEKLLEDKSAENEKSPEAAAILEELAERKAKEKNFIVHGVMECKSLIGEERKAYDIGKVRSILKTCKVKEDAKLGKIFRVGRYDKEKPKRPILVQFEEIDDKKELFRNIKQLRESEGFEEVRINNDLTRNEREQEGKLREEAKALTQASGEFIFKVRGPPWGRKIIKERAPEKK